MYIYKWLTERVVDPLHVGGYKNEMYIYLKNNNLVTVCARLSVSALDSYLLMGGGESQITWMWGNQPNYRATHTLGSF